MCEYSIASKQKIHILFQYFLASLRGGDGIWQVLLVSGWKGAHIVDWVPEHSATIRLRVLRPCLCECPSSAVSLMYTLAAHQRIAPVQGGLAHPRSGARVRRRACAASTVHVVDVSTRRPGKCAQCPLMRCPSIGCRLHQDLASCRVCRRPSRLLLLWRLEGVARSAPSAIYVFLAALAFVETASAHSEVLPVSTGGRCPGPGDGTRRDARVAPGRPFVLVFLPRIAVSFSALQPIALISTSCARPRRGDGGAVQRGRVGGGGAATAGVRQPARQHCVEALGARCGACPCVRLAHVSGPTRASAWSSRAGFRALGAIAKVAPHLLPSLQTPQPLLRQGPPNLYPPLGEVCSS